MSTHFYMWGKVTLKSSYFLMVRLDTVMENFKHDKSNTVVSTCGNFYGAWGNGKATLNLILELRQDDVFSWAWMGSQVEVLASPRRRFIESLNPIWS